MNKVPFIILIIFASIGIAVVISTILNFIYKKKEAKILKEQIREKNFIIDVADEVAARIKKLD